MTGYRIWNSSQIIENQIINVVMMLKYAALCMQDVEIPHLFQIFKSNFFFSPVSLPFRAVLLFPSVLVVPELTKVEAFSINFHKMNKNFWEASRNSFNWKKIAKKEKIRYLKFQDIKLRHTGKPSDPGPPANPCSPFSPFIPGGPGKPGLP